MQGGIQQYTKVVVHKVSYSSTQEYARWYTVVHKVCEATLIRKHWQKQEELRKWH
jgi:hypothetical protein